MAQSVGVFPHPPAQNVGVFPHPAYSNSNARKPVANHRVQVRVLTSLCLQSSCKVGNVGTRSALLKGHLLTEFVQTEVDRGMPVHFFAPNPRSKTPPMLFQLSTSSTSAKTGHYQPWSRALPLDLTTMAQWQQPSLHYQHQPGFVS